MPLSRQVKRYLKDWDIMKNYRNKKMESKKYVAEGKI